MTLKGLWIRGFCTVGIAVATQADAVFTHWSDDWGVKEWSHALAGLAVAFFIALRGFKDQSITDYKRAAGLDDPPDVPGVPEHIDAAESPVPERVPTRTKAR